jgi:hypothetical protein
MKLRGSRLRFDAPNKKIFRDLRTLCVQDFKASPASRGRDHWNIEKWRAQVSTYMEENEFGPITDRNVDAFILILRSTIIKKKAFQRTADKDLI